MSKVFSWSLSILSLVATLQPCPRFSRGLRSFLAANSTKKYFLMARLLSFFVTFGTKVPNLTFCEKMRQCEIWKWREREEIKRKWRNVTSKPHSISSFSLHLLSISSFSLHFLLHFLILSPFSHSPAATSCATLVWGVFLVGTSNIPDYSEKTTRTPGPWYSPCKKASASFFFDRENGEGVSKPPCTCSGRNGQKIFADHKV